MEGLYWLGNIKEATRLARQLADEDFLRPLFWLNNRIGQSEQLIAYLEQRWPDLDAFQAAHPAGRSGYALMADISYAYKRDYNEPRFADALGRLEAAITHLDEQGINNHEFERNRAIYLAVSDNTEAAIASLEKALDLGLRDGTPLSKAWPAFESIADDPRFIAVEARMLALINIEREKLGLEPIQL